LTAAAATAFTDGGRLYGADEPSFAAWRRMYADVGPGTWLRQPALARTLERLAADGPDASFSNARDYIVDARISLEADGRSKCGTGRVCNRLFDRRALPG